MLIHTPLVRYMEILICKCQYQFIYKVFCTSCCALKSKLEMTASRRGRRSCVCQCLIDTSKNYQCYSFICFLAYLNLRINNVPFYINTYYQMCKLQTFRQLSHGYFLIFAKFIGLLITIFHIKWITFLFNKSRSVHVHFVRA